MSNTAYFVNFSVLARSNHETKIFNNLRLVKYRNLKHFEECESKGFPIMGGYYLQECLPYPWKLEKIIDAIFVTDLLNQKILEKWLVITTKQDKT